MGGWVGSLHTVIIMCLYPNFALFFSVCPQLSECLHLGPFFLSPTEFSLGKGGSVEFTVVFSPPAVGLYSEPFTMACDNGQTLTFTLKG